jgi:hypothetical protein
VPQTPAASSSEFAAALAARLNEVAPEGFTVIAEHATVAIRQHGGVTGFTDVAELVESSENLDHLPKNLSTAARAILSAVQDWIADTSNQPWPVTTRQPNPGVRVTGTHLAMWFGDPDEPMLTLRPLDVRLGLSGRLVLTS